MSRTEKFGVTVAMSEYVEKYRNVEHFLGFCRECKNYGTLWACPPFDKQIPIEGYRYANIVAVKILVDPAMCERTMTPEELHEATIAILRPVRAEIDSWMLSLEESTPSSRALFPGSCIGCEKGECSRLVGEPCVKPSKMRPSLEAMGFDVMRTTSELLDIELKWSSDRLPEYFTLVSALFADVKINI